MSVDILGTSCDQRRSIVFVFIMWVVWASFLCISFSLLFFLFTGGLCPSTSIYFVLFQQGSTQTLLLLTACLCEFWTFFLFLCIGVCLLLPLLFKVNICTGFIVVVLFFFFFFFFFFGGGGAVPLTPHFYGVFYFRFLSVYCVRHLVS